MLLGLDVASLTGVAFGGPTSGAPRTLCWQLPEGPINFERSLSALRTTVMSFCKFNKVEIVCLEAALQVVDRYHSADAAFVLTSLSAVVREAAQTFGCRVIKPVSCDEWRRAFIGTSRVTTEEGKRLAMQRCDQLGWRYQDHNAAEAAGVWYWGMATYYPKWNPGRAA